MKKNNMLLSENWIRDLPNSKYLDFENNPSLLNDFGFPQKVWKCLGECHN